MDIIGDIKQTFKEGSALTRLIYINIGVFLVLKVIGVFFLFIQQPTSLSDWLAIPSNLIELGMKPWTPVSYMFLHDRFLHLLFNILGLYWFGKLFLFHFEGNKLLSVYLLGGLSGAALFVISFNIVPAFEKYQIPMLGASAAVYAILVAAASYDPERKIMLPLIGTFPLKYIALVYVLLSVIQISTSNPGGNIAHLGGAFWGWFYIYQLRKGKDMGAGLVKLLDKIGEWLKGVFKERNNMKVSYKKPPRDDRDYNRQQNNQQDQINQVLDKIGKTGYDSLSKQEKELLFKQGKK